MCKRLICFSFVTVLILTSAASAELVGWWKLDDGSGIIATDSAGSNDGTLIGDTAWVDGMLDGALSFDGDGDYVDCGNDPVFNPTGSFSITIWAYIADWGINWGRCMFSKGGDGDAAGRMGWSIRRYSDETLCFTTAGAEGVGTDPGAEDNTNLKGNTAPPMNEWFHIACVYDVNNMAYIYINGEVDASRPTTGTIVAGTGNPSVYIGTRTNTDGTAPDDWAEAWFNGMLDDARYYDNALSMEDVHVLVYGDAHKSYKPNPEDGTIEVPRDAAMTWKSGLYTGTHDLYFGTNFDDVNEATRDNPLGVLTQDLDVNSFDPDGLLDWGFTYYWRVDEVNETEADSPWKGDIWSFTVLNFPVIIDDFEDYNDFPPNEVWNTWIDGYGDATNGSTAGYPDPDFVAGEHYVETNIVHSGEQSLPIFYDNAAGLSEVTKSMAGTSNWTQDGVVTYTMFVQGDAANADEPMYVAADNAVVNLAEGLALTTEWTQVDVPLQNFADMGANLNNVGSLFIGLGNKSNPTAGGSGVVYIDDIRLYK